MSAQISCQPPVAPSRSRTSHTRGGDATPASVRDMTKLCKKEKRNPFHQNSRMEKMSEQATQRTCRRNGPDSLTLDDPGTRIDTNSHTLKHMAQQATWGRTPSPLPPPCPAIPPHHLRTTVHSYSHHTQSWPTLQGSRLSVHSLLTLAASCPARQLESVPLLHPLNAAAAARAPSACQYLANFSGELVRECCSSVESWHHSPWHMLTPAGHLPPCEWLHHGGCHPRQRRMLRPTWEAA